MLVSVRLFKNQILHYLKVLDGRLKFEFFLLVTIFLVFFTEKSIDVINQLLLKPEISRGGLTFFFEHIIIILLAISTPFIYTHLLPRQRLLQTMRLQPLGSADALGILIMAYIKYQILVIILVFPVLIAILFTLDIIFFLHVLINTVVTLLILFLWMHYCVNSNKKNRIKIYSIYFTAIIVYFLLFYTLYTNQSYYQELQTGVMIISLALLLRFWHRQWEKWDYDLFRIQIIRHKNYSSRLYQNSFKKYPVGSNKFYALILKEIIGYIRNSHFIRIKTTGVILYLLTILIIIYYSSPADEFSAVSLVTIIYLWIHYSHQFNEKYVLPETDFFLKTFPLRYSHIWLAKFITEFLFLVPFFIVLISISLLSGTQISATISLFLTVFIFSLFIVATIISVKLLFYDNPRKAGYVYHFMVIFSLLMIYNFYLVGPVIILFMLIYMSFLSYRQFVG